MEIEDNPDADERKNDWLKERVVFVGWLTILMLSVLGGAFIGPINNLLPCKDKTFVVQAWRFVPLSMLYIVLIFPVYVLIQKKRGVTWKLLQYK